MSATSVSISSSLDTSCNVSSRYENNATRARNAKNVGIRVPPSIVLQMEIKILTPSLSDETHLLFLLSCLLTQNRLESAFGPPRTVKRDCRLYPSPLILTATSVTTCMIPQTVVHPTPKTFSVMRLLKIAKALILVIHYSACQSMQATLQV